MYYAVGDGGILATYISGTTGARIFGRVARTAECVIPAKVNLGYTEYYVTEIATDAFRFEPALVALTIPDFIQHIGYGEKSFDGLVLHLTHETPLSTYGLFASAKAIFVPDELLEKYKTQLYYCSDIIFPESSLTDDGLLIQNNNVVAYYGSSSAVIIPDGINRVHRDIFAGCDWIESLTLPFVGAKLTGAAETNFGYIFGGNENVPSTLTSVTITQEDRIENNAFANCKYITSITLPNTVREIGDYAFYGCEALFSVNIPEGVTSIGKYAFNMCDRLYSIFIPDSATSIGDFALAAGAGLRYLTVGGANRIYRSDNNCVIETASKTLIAGCSRSIIPQGVTTIGAGAFWGVTQLTAISIPASVKTIEADAFAECASLATINFAGTKAQWDAINKSEAGIAEDVTIEFTAK
jgi:hypothetical protein